MGSESEIRGRYHEGHALQTLAPGRPSGVEDVGLRWVSHLIAQTVGPARRKEREYVECREEEGEKADKYESAGVPYRL